MLKYAWLDKNVDFEIQAYKGIAYWYYYLGLLKKSKLYFICINRSCEGNFDLIIGTFYYKRFSKGKQEPESSNMKIYALKRYVNEFKIRQLEKPERMSYTSTTVYKIKDYTNDYSVAVKYLDQLTKEETER